MQLEVNVIKENEDGSADCEVNLDEEAKIYLVNFGLVEMLKRAVDEGKKYTPEKLIQELQELQEENEEENEEENKEDRKEWEQLELSFDNKDKNAIYIKADPEAIDEFVATSLREAYIATYMKMWHPEDTVYNIKLRKHLRTILRHYMIGSEADDFIERVDEEHKEEDDDE